MEVFVSHQTLDLSRTRAGVPARQLHICRQELGKQFRIIIDARRANCLLASPPGLDLCTAESVAHFENSSDVLNDDTASALAFGMWNVRDAFHRCRMSDGLALYFGLGTATASELIIVVSNGNISHDLAWACLPSSSAGRRTFCQRSVQSLHQSVSPDTPRLADRRSPCQMVRGVRLCGQRRNFLLVNFESRAGSRESFCSFSKDADARPTKKPTRYVKALGPTWSADSLPQPRRGCGE